MKEVNSNLPEYGVLIQSRRKRPDFADAGHKHSHPSIIYVASGNGTFEIDGKSCDLKSNTVISLQKEKIHKLTDKPRKAMTVFTLYFKREVPGLNKYILDYLFVSDEPFNLPVYYAEQIRRNLRQMLYEQTTRPPGYKLALQQNLILTVLQLYRAKLEQSKQPQSDITKTSLERVRSVLDFTARNCHEQYTLSDAAKMARVSQRQFTNLCRKITRTSYIRFLNEKRCEKAATLLIQTDMPVAAIAFEVGYEELSTFYRSFKKLHHQSPLAFREKT